MRQASITMENGSIHGPEWSLARMAGQLAGFVLALVLVAMPLDSARARSGPDSVADLAEKLIDAVVNISTTQVIKGHIQGLTKPKLPPGSPFEKFFDDFFEKQKNGKRRKPRKVRSLGSGFVIDKSGIVITNNHVIKDADEITIKFNDGTKLKAELVGRDAKTDLAVLRVKPKKPLVAVKFGDSSKMRVGDWVMAIGNPFGLGGTVTLGIVSARNRNINSGPYDDYIQTDAAINKGNSGGPLFNLDGDVIGINTAIISPSGGSIGIGFSVPSNTAMNVVEQLRKYGETRRGWLGVRIQTVTDEIAESLGLDEARGALVAGVNPQGPSAKAGIEPGDVILEFDGKDVARMRDLPRMVAGTAIGKSVKVVVLRKGRKKTIQLTLGRLEEGEKLARAARDKKKGELSEEKPEMAVTEMLGMTLTGLTDELRTRFKIAEKVKGVLIAKVDPAGPAAEKGIRAGFVIMEVNQEEVLTPGDARKAVAAARKKGRKSVLLLLADGSGDLRFVAVRIDK